MGSISEARRAGAHVASNVTPSSGSAFFRMVSIHFEPQQTNKRIERIVAYALRESPSRFKQRPALDYPLGFLHEKFEQQELGAAEINGNAAATDLVRDDVHDQVPHLQFFEQTPPACGAPGRAGAPRVPGKRTV